MARTILRRRVRAKQQHVPISLPILTEIQAAQARLRRAQEILSALAFCADEEAELSLGPVAVAARDLIDCAVDGLAALLPKQGSAGWTIERE